MSEPEQVTVYTVGLGEPAMRAMHLASDFTGYDRTATINRALQVYALMVEVCVFGPGSLTIRDLLADRPDAVYQAWLEPVDPPQVPRRRRSWWPWRRKTAG